MYFGVELSFKEKEILIFDMMGVILEYIVLNKINEILKGKFFV